MAMKDQSKPTYKDNDNDKIITRRHLLQILLISSSSIVPLAWTTPIVEAATLPPHAQASRNMFDLSCQADGGLKNQRVAQDGQITNIKVYIPPIYPYNVELYCRVTTSDPRYRAKQFQTLSAFKKDDDGVVYPTFDLLAEVNDPVIAVGSTITFTVTFADQEQFLDDSCSTTITVVEPTGRRKTTNQKSPQWRKING